MNEIPTEIKISKRPENIKIDGIKIEANKCIRNSYEVAKTNPEVEIVEGVLIFTDIDGNSKAAAHMWNKIKDEYFDITNETVWKETLEETETTDTKYFIGKIHKHNSFTDSIEFSEETNEDVKYINMKLEENSKK